MNGEEKEVLILSQPRPVPENCLAQKMASYEGPERTNGEHKPKLEMPSFAQPRAKKQGLFHGYEPSVKARQRVQDRCQTSTRFLLSVGNLCLQIV